MALKYTRVKDKDTGHEYDVLAHKVDPEKHERVNRDHYPDSSHPRAPKPNVKTRRPPSRPKAPGKQDPTEQGAESA